MADFATNMMSLFGFDPTKGQMLTGPVPLGARAPQTQAGADQAQATADVTGRPYSPEAADATTPSPVGRVLARLRTPGRAAPTGRAASTGGTGDGAIGDGLGSDLAAGVGNVKVGMDRGSAFIAGLAGAAKNVEERRTAAAKAHAESQKANLELLKSMFDMQGKIEDRKQKAQEAASTSARQDRQDAETKRWHDIMAPSYAKDADGKKELGPKDAILAEQRLREMSGYNPSDDNWSFLKPDEQERRKKVFQRLYENHFGRPYEFDAEGLPAVRQKNAPAGAGKAAAAPSSDDDEEDDATPSTTAAPTPPPRPSGLTPAAQAPAGQSPGTAPPTSQPAAPAAATQQPSPAAPQVWRKYQSTDGTMKLFNPLTGESKPIDAGPAPTTEELFPQPGN